MMKKKLFIIVGSVVIIIIFLGTFSVVSKNKNTKQQTLRIVIVEKGDIIIKMTESGSVEAVTTVEIKSELAGEVRRLYVEEGDSVKVGDKLALVQQESSQARQVAQSRASLERTKLDLEEAERNLERKRELYELGFISKKDVEDAEKSYKSNKIQYDLSEKQLWLILGGTEQAESQSLTSRTFDNIIVSSPIKGLVISINVEVGEMITSGTQAYGGGGTTIMTVADLSEMIVKADINEVDVIKAKKGQPVKIVFDAIKGKTYQGIVKKITPAGIIKQNIVVYPLEVEILDPDESIRPGMTADLDIIAGNAEGVLYVPKEAVIKRGNHSTVMLIENGKPVPKEVVTGLEDDVKVEIKEGLKEGDKVLATQSGLQTPTGSERFRRGGPPHPM